MEDAKAYLTSTEPAMEGLFRLLNQYGWHKVRAIVDIVNSKTRQNLKIGKTNYSSVDVARDVIAGSILQIAYVAIKQYSVVSDKPDSVLDFVSKIDASISVYPWFSALVDTGGSCRVD
jgi:hypothetical protein